MKVVVLQDVENSRLYVDDLYSSDPEKCLNSLICIKNSVIGSNRQKESVIAQGIVSRLMQLLGDHNVNTTLRLESAITIGSLAKGTKDHAELLIKCGTIPMMLDLIEEGDANLIDAALCCLRTLAHKDSGNGRTVYTQNQVQRLLSYAEPNEMLMRQSCVASILSDFCKRNAEQVCISYE